MPPRTRAGHPQAFPRARRLRRQRLIRPLFARSDPAVLSVTAGCIRLLARLVPRPLLGADIPVQTGFATGRMAGAVARNRIRRQLREVYRRHQALLVDLFLYRTEALTLMVLFRGTGPMAADIRRDLPEALRRLAARLPGESSMSGEQR